MRPRVSAARACSRLKAVRYKRYSVFTREYLAPETSAGFDENLFIVHADGTKLRQITDRPDRVELYPVWAPDGKALLYPWSIDYFGPNWHGAIAVYDLKSGTETDVGEPNRGGSPSWQPLPRAKVDDLAVHAQ